MSKKIEGKQFIDSGTISRWERQANTPSLYNQIYILRKLGFKLQTSSLLRGETLESTKEQAIELLLQRFNRFAGFSDKPYRAVFPQFDYTETDNIDSFLTDPVIQAFNRQVLGVDFFNPKLLSIVLSELDISEVKVVKFFRNTQLVGHIAYAKCQTVELIEFLNRHCKLNLSSHFMDDINGKTLLNFSTYTGDFGLYLFYVARLTEVLESDPAIDWYIGHSFINDHWQVLKKLGAKLLVSGNPAEQGAVKIGKTYTDSVMFSMTASTMLSSPLYALQKSESEHYASIQRRDSEEM
ncbi:hypothetical protein L9G16_04055 [Shewanella sp. A25]|nr:hypothetical protein [Shewanella shenzhenensis]